MRVAQIRVLFEICLLSIVWAHAAIPALFLQTTQEPEHRPLTSVWQSISSEQKNNHQSAEKASWMTRSQFENDNVVVKDATAPMVSLEDAIDDGRRLITSPIGYASVTIPESGLTHPASLVRQSITINPNPKSTTTIPQPELELTMAPAIDSQLVPDTRQPFHGSETPVVHLDDDSPSLAGTPVSEERHGSNLISVFSSIDDSDARNKDSLLSLDEDTADNDDLDLPIKHRRKKPQTTSTVTPVSKPSHKGVTKIVAAVGGMGFLASLGVGYYMYKRHSAQKDTLPQEPMQGHFELETPCFVE